MAATLKHFIGFEDVLWCLDPTEGGLRRKILTAILNALIGLKKVYGILKRGPFSFDFDMLA